MSNKKLSVRCTGCDDIVATVEADVKGVCLACRVGDADRFDPGNEVRRGLFEAERVLLLLIEEEPESKLFRGKLQLELALKGVQKAHWSG